MATKSAKKAVSTSKGTPVKGKTAAKPAAKTTAPVKPARAAMHTAEPLTHRLDALLHTMRCIAQHEDRLCSLLHDARKSGRLNAGLRRDLHSILAELPAEEYTDDLHAVLEIAASA